MILKIGYFGKDGIECYRYFDDFENVVISGLESGYTLDTEECLFKYKDKEIDDPEFIFFNLSDRTNGTHVVHICYYPTDGKMRVMTALGGTVYLLNNNGRTVDRY